MGQEFISGACRVIGWLLSLFLLTAVGGALVYVLIWGIVWHLMGW